MGGLPELGRIAYYPTHYRRTGGCIILSVGRERSFGNRLVIEGSTRAVPGEVRDRLIEPIQHPTQPIIGICTAGTSSEVV